MTPTREQVTQWALNAGCVSATFWPHDFSGLLATFERFAAIAHAAGRDQGLREAKEVIATFPHWIGPTAKQEINAAIEQLRAK